MARFPDSGGATPLRLRASINTGPCIAVNLNTGVDYFGSSVNVAAKLQACAGAGDIAMSTAVLDSPGVRDYLSEEGALLEDGVHQSDAGAVPYSVWRTDVSRARAMGTQGGSVDEEPKRL